MKKSWVLFGVKIQWYVAVFDDYCKFFKGSIEGSKLSSTQKKNSSAQMIRNERFKLSMAILSVREREREYIKYRGAEYFDKWVEPKYNNDDAHHSLHWSARSFFFFICQCVCFSRSLFLNDNTRKYVLQIHADYTHSHLLGR